MLIKKSTDNMNQMENEKYDYAPNYIVTKSLLSKNSRIVFNFDRIKKSKQVAKRLNKFDKKLHEQKKRKLTEKLYL